ncbi:MAG: Amidohydrolase [Syntrophorhabdus sp. PtaU1.Bin153]|nr:MAG: Amidohydrolase [Syntrophorhabdus sp. PtaU1.Bin153]
MLPKYFIDFHIHLFPDKFFDAIWSYFNGHILEVLYKLYYRECIKYLRDSGVGPIVFSNYAHKKGVAQILNDWNLKVIKEFPDLYCFAAYHPDDDDALERAERMLGYPNILGIKLQCMVQQLSPCDSRLFPLYEMIIERKRRLLMHVGTGPHGNEYVGITQFKKALNRFPDLPANVPHMGGLEFKAFIELLDDHPALYLDTSYSFVPNVPYRFNLDNGVLEKYKDRILYGSDFPNLIHPREIEIKSLLDLGLSSDFYSKVFLENGLKLISSVKKGEKINLDTQSFHAFPGQR